MADQSGVPLLRKSMKTLIKFEHPMLGYRIEFTGRAWRLMSNYTQSWPWNKEAGGQMFGRADGYRLVVEEVTGPRKGDRRTRHSFEVDAVEAATEINERLVKGLIYFGDWHTHPEDYAKPSHQDRANAGNLIRGAPNNPFLLLVIVGIRNVYVGLYNTLKLLQLSRVRDAPKPWWL